MKILFAIERAVLFLTTIIAAIYFFNLAAGCAARRVPASDRIPEEQRFFHECHQVTPANADGFLHFICSDPKQRQWEVLVRREAQ